MISDFNSNKIGSEEYIENRELKTLHALEIYGKSPSKKILVLRSDSNGLPYLEAIQDDLFLNPLDWIKYRLMLIFSFLSFTNNYKLSHIHDYLNGFFAAKKVERLDNESLFTVKNGIKILNRKFATRKLRRIALDTLAAPINKLKKTNKLKTSFHESKKANKVQKNPGYSDLRAVASKNVCVNARGVSNGYNRCYMNSIIKLMKCSPFLQKRLEDQKINLEQTTGLQANFVRAMYDLQQKLTINKGSKDNQYLLQRSSSGPHSVVDRFAEAFDVFVNENSNDQDEDVFPIKDYYQQDAQEFFGQVLANLFHPDSLEFQFTQKNRHIYQSENIYIPTLDKEEPQTSIFMPLEIPSYDGALTSIQEVFSGFYRDELIELETINIKDKDKSSFQTLNENIFTKEELESKNIQLPVQSENILVGDKAPQILPIHVKRFDEKLQKRTTNIDVPYLLQAQHTTQMTEIAQAVEYILRGVVVHAGSTITSGHYYTYIPDPSTLIFNKELGCYECTDWYIHNDKDVRKVSYEDIKDDICSNGYLMLYENLSDLAKKMS